MKRLLFITAIILYSLAASAQFADTSALNNYIRENIRDKRPEKVTAEQIQAGMLGISNTVTKYNALGMSLSNNSGAGIMHNNRMNSFGIDSLSMFQLGFPDQEGGSNGSFMMLPNMFNFNTNSGQSIMFGSVFNMSGIGSMNISNSGGGSMNFGNNGFTVSAPFVNLGDDDTQIVLHNSFSRLMFGDRFLELSQDGALLNGGSSYNIRPGAQIILDTLATSIGHKDISDTYVEDMRIGIDGKVAIPSLGTSGETKVLQVNGSGEISASSDIRYTPSPRPEFFGLKEYIIGSKPFTTRSAKLMVTDSLVVDSGYHAIGDYSFISQTSGGSAFASFDVATTLGGAFDWSHFFGVQSRPSLTGTGNLTDFYGYQSLLQHYGSGTVANAAGMMIEDIVGSGSVTNQYGIYIKNQTHGANNWALYSAGGNSYFAGNVGIGVSVPTVPLSVNGTIAAGGLTLTTTPYVSSIRSNLISSNYRSGFNIETNGSNNSAISSAPTASPVFRWLWKQSTPVDYTSDTDELMRLTGAGNLGIGNSAPTARIDLNSSTGYNQLRLRTSYTPTGTSDANGNTGDVSWDENYIYIKTGSGWKRSALTTF